MSKKKNGQNKKSPSKPQNGNTSANNNIPGTPKDKGGEKKSAPPVITSSKTSSSWRPIWILISLSSIVAVVAVVYVNEDIRHFIGSSAARYLPNYLSEVVYPSKRTVSHSPEPVHSHGEEPFNDLDFEEESIYHKVDKQPTPQPTANEQEKLSPFISGDTTQQTGEDLEKQKDKSPVRLKEIRIESELENLHNSDESLSSKPVIIEANSGSPVDINTLDEKNVQVNQPSESRTSTEFLSAPNSEQKEKIKGESVEQTTVETKEQNLSKPDKTIDSLGEDDVEATQGKELEEEKNKKPRRKDYEKYSITSKADYKIRKKLDTADTLFEQGELDEAQKHYERILAKYPDSPRAVYGKAETLNKLAELRQSNPVLEESIETMSRVLQLPDTPDELFIAAGRKLADRQQFRGWGGKAVGTWKQLIQRFPDKLEFQNQLGVSYLMIGQNEKARNAFKTVLEKTPSDGFAQVHLGFIIKTTDNNPQAAIPLMRAGIESGAPGTVDGRFFFQLGDALQRTNQSDEAYRIYSLGAEKGLFLSTYQRSLYNSEGLTGRPWWTPEQTGYVHNLKLLEDNWQTIREEGLSQLDQKTGAFIPEEENLREKGDWKQFTLYQRGRKVEQNCAKVPKTCALLDRIPDATTCKRGQIKFSVMNPGVHVWPHCGPTNCRIRAHLGLIVPPGPKIRVVNETREWLEGKFIIFDDSFEHEVWHNGKDLRLVLIVDFWHPELTQQQRRNLSPI
ncbi:hypothetical protein CHS0354_015358 [Potamilus streckersoni]|uniref:Aspartyl/asparaginy/proline hydroxylase domain-containing protein n=1 Tax=Potamilus streckersoni TaxID=2493646 RepID=A0AAE0TAT7_9BIVA|nr:hypothetical protein CHS0354_015358 [Potamilus streckersoni]